MYDYTYRSSADCDLGSLFVLVTFGRQRIARALLPEAARFFSPRIAPAAMRGFFLPLSHRYKELLGAPPGRKAGENRLQ
ncbi:hypothetical protein P7A99_10215 [Caulobacter endophyticus]|nr:hypothetical protein [Caulobacter endophyticus]